MIAPKLPKNENQRLEALNSYQILDTEYESRFDDFTKLAAQICGAKMSVISLVDSDRQWFKSVFGIQAIETPRDVSFCGHTILEAQNLVVENAHLDKRFFDNPLVTGDPKITFYAGANLIDAKGYKLGTLCVLDPTSKKVNEQQLESLNILARQVVNLIQSYQSELNKIVEDFIIKSIDDGLAVYNKSFTPIYSNQMAHEILGLSYKQFIGQDLYSRNWKTTDEYGNVLTPDQYPVSISLTQGISVKDFIIGIDAPGKGIVWASVSSYPLEFKNERYAAVVFKNINEKFVSIRQNYYLNTAIQSLHEGVVIQDKNGVIIQCNDAATKILGLSKEQMEGKTSMDPDWNAIRENGKDFPGNEHPTMLTLATGIPQKDVIMGIRSGDKNKVWISITSSPIYLNKSIKTNKKNTPDAAIATFKDVTVNYIHQSKIKLLYTAFSQLKNGLLITSFDGTIEFANKSFLKSKGYTQADLIGKNVNVLKSGQQTEEFYKVMWQTLKKGKIYESKILNKKKNGEVIAESVIINPIVDTGGVISNFVAVYNNLDEQETRVQLLKNLEEKELLLKEIHHRVKNNLQIVSSLLSLQIMQLRDTQSENALRDAQQRINSIALIHEKLYRSKSINTINAKEYLVDLAKNILSNLGQEDKVIVDFKIDSIELIFDKLIPCGLILNEILINTIKYAFTKAGGKIKISFIKIEDKITFKMEDNGVGLENPDVILKSKTLGSKLIIMLVKQLKGKLSINTAPQKGLKYEITFGL